jgi:hypothetical protein
MLKLIYVNDDEHIFPSMPLSQMNNVESSLSKAMNGPETQPDQTSSNESKISP